MILFFIIFELKRLIKNLLFWSLYIIIEVYVGFVMVVFMWIILIMMGLVWFFFYSLFFYVLEYKYVSRSCDLFMCWLLFFVVFNLENIYIDY